MLIVDDFIDNATGLREAALRLTYPDLQGNFPGRNSLERINIEGLTEALKNTTLTPGQRAAYEKAKALQTEGLKQLTDGKSEMVMLNIGGDGAVSAALDVTNGAKKFSVSGAGVTGRAGVQMDRASMETVFGEDGVKDLQKAGVANYVKSNEATVTELRNKAAKALKDAGINSVFYVSQNTAHEFQSWRRSLREMAPLLFKD
jgi:hypothetical protein